eukprot:972455_1
MPRPIARSNIDDTGHRVEALGSWDHGLEPYDIGDQTKDHKVESLQEFNEFMKHAVHLTLDTLAGGLKRIQESAFFDDPHLREEYNSHTEEVIAGEKMAVANVIHQNSFEAPC